MKGTGELPGTTYEEHNYEGYGPSGVALFIQVLTDNKNRTTSELRHMLAKHGGSLGEAGCVAWMFEQKGFITVEKSKVDEDRLIEVALDAGADDVNSEEPDAYEVYTPPASFYSVQKTLEGAGIPILSAEFSRIRRTRLRSPERRKRSSSCV